MGEGLIVDLMMRSENEICSILIDSAFKVHTALGPGLLESAYEKCLAYEARKRGLSVLTQVPLPLLYDETIIDCGYRLDLLAEDKVIVEIKAVERFDKIHLAQILTYLKLSGCSIGYLINFNVSGLKNGIKRVIL